MQNSSVIEGVRGQIEVRGQRANRGQRVRGQIEVRGSEVILTVPERSCRYQLKVIRNYIEL